MRLWASAYSSATQRTLVWPRTGMRCSPRLRACALTHSAVAARSLYSSLAWSWPCAGATLPPQCCRRAWVGACRRRCRCLARPSWPVLRAPARRPRSCRPRPRSVRAQESLRRPATAQARHPGAARLVGPSARVAPCRAAGADLHAHDHLGVAVGCELGVVRRTEAAIGHLHHSGLGISGRCRGLGLAAIAPLDRLQLRQPLQCRFDSLLHLAPRALLCSDLAPAVVRRVGIEFSLELAHSCARLLQVLLQAGLAPKRRRPRAGAHPHSVLRDALQLHRTGGHQRSQTRAEQLVQRRAVRHPEVQQAVVIDLHAPADPAIRVMFEHQPRQLPRTAHTFERRVQPQSQQDLRRDGAAAHGAPWRALITAYMPLRSCRSTHAHTSRARCPWGSSDSRSIGRSSI